MSEERTLLTAFCANQQGAGQGDSALGRRVDGTHWPGKVKMSVHESKSE